MKESDFNISGMSCQHCVKAVEKELSMLDVDYYEVEIGMAKIEYDESKVKVSDIERAISDAGFKMISES
ncbi:MAG: copper chaperone CopZ [Melioribacteraceae bacterium]|nr:MAG: copper chaperone CopZ [Melioribacteraceae bacterium]